MWDIVSQLTSRVLGAPVGAGRRQRKRPRFRPGIERLEGREVPATFLVPTLADVVNPADGKVSLREAISRANATAEQDTVVLQPGVYRIGLAGANEDANVTGDFDVKNPLTIVGQSASNTVIDGGKLDRLFDVHGTLSVGLARLTLRNGVVVQTRGGAVRAETGNLRLDACIVSGNSAYNGGGIYADGGNVTLAGCVVSGNGATVGGGGIHLDAGTLTVRDGVVRNNRAGVGGGGILALKATLTNCNISGNGAPKGGGVYAEIGSVTLVGCVVSRNVATETGGGISVIA